MSKDFLKIVLCLICCWTICVPSFCQVFDSMSAKEAGEARSKMIAYSKEFIGVPYVYGGDTKSGMDCSGFIFTVVNDSLGIKLPRSTSGLYAGVRIIDDKEREPGDLVFFKTVGSKISHVGLYLGRDHFIHAASDGPNTGVIVSSLKESYWGRTYACTGRFLPASGSGTSGEQLVQGESSVTGSGTEVATSDKGFFGKVILEGSLTGDWNFFTPESFYLISRGFTLDLHARYADFTLQPGFGMSLGYDQSMGIFKIPLLFSLTISDYVRVYGGPVFSIGSAVIPNSQKAPSPEPVKASIFPGVLGVAFQTPQLKTGVVGLSLVQDIRYSVYNNMEGGALSFLNSLASGLVFSTGIRVTLPLSRVL